MIFRHACLADWMLISILRRRRADSPLPPSSGEGLPLDVQGWSAPATVPPINELAHFHLVFKGTVTQEASEGRAHATHTYAWDGSARLPSGSLNMRCC
jgi:hypothetical protein